MGSWGGKLDHSHTQTHTHTHTGSSGNLRSRVGGKFWDMFSSGPHLGHEEPVRCEALPFSAMAKRMEDEHVGGALPVIRTR